MAAEEENEEKAAGAVESSSSPLLLLPPFDIELAIKANQKALARKPPRYAHFGQKRNVWKAVDLNSYSELVTRPLFQEKMTMSSSYFSVDLHDVAYPLGPPSDQPICMLRGFYIVVASNNQQKQQQQQKFRFRFRSRGTTTVVPDAHSNHHTTSGDDEEMLPDDYKKAIDEKEKHLLNDFQPTTFGPGEYVAFNMPLDILNVNSYWNIDFCIAGAGGEQEKEEEEKEEEEAPSATVLTKDDLPYAVVAYGHVGDSAWYTEKMPSPVDWYKQYSTRFYVGLEGSGEEMLFVRPMNTTRERVRKRDDVARDHCLVRTNVVPIQKKFRGQYVYRSHYDAPDPPRPTFFGLEI